MLLELRLPCFFGVLFDILHRASKFQLGLAPQLQPVALLAHPIRIDERGATASNPIAVGLQKGRRLKK